MNMAGVFPTMVNLGAIQVNVITNNSSVSVGTASNGDTYSIQKFNEGTGAILGNANLVFANLSLVNDPNILDTFAPQFCFKPTLGGLSF